MATGQGKLNCKGCGKKKYSANSVLVSMRDGSKKRYCCECWHAVQMTENTARVAAAKAAQAQEVAEGLYVVLVETTDLTTEKGFKAICPAQRYMQAVARNARAAGFKLSGGAVAGEYTWDGGRIVLSGPGR